MDFAKAHSQFKFVVLALICSCCTSTVVFSQTNSLPFGFQPTLIQTSTDLSDIGSTDQIVESAGMSCGQDELWFVSARQVQCACRDLSQLVTESCQLGQWSPSHFAALTDSHVRDSAKETVIYVHGNRTDEYWAKSRGMQVYQNLFACTEGCRPPVRFVIWAWKSDKVGGPARDFKTKSDLAFRMGAIFAESTAAFDQKPPMVIGYSLGCQIIASALTHYCLDTASQHRLAVIAPVFDCGYANRCSLGDQFSGLVSKTLVFSNRKDSVTRAAKACCRVRSRNTFVTFEQWACRPSHPLGDARMFDVTGASQRKHSVVLYTKMPVIRKQINQLLLENAANYVSISNESQDR